MSGPRWPPRVPGRTLSQVPPAPSDHCRGRSRRGGDWAGLVLWPRPRDPRTREGVHRAAAGYLWPLSARSVASLN